MTTMRWFRTGGPGRGAPTGQVPGRAKHLALALVALAGLAQQGCSSLGIGNGCGSCGWRPRLFHRQSADCCGPGGGGLPAGDFSGAPTVVAPGAIVPAPPGTADDLTPIPSGSSAGSGSSGGETGAAPRGASGTSAAGKASYEAYRYPFRARPSRGTNLARANVPSEPARRPAPRATSRPQTNPLDNLPPLTLPLEPDGSAGSSSSSSSSRGALPRAAEEVPTSLAVPPAHAQLAPSEASQDPVPAEVAVTVVPGIQRFQGLEPKLAGGSLPSLTGLDWLADKGYKTILDLREPGQEQPAFTTEVTNRGFRYIPLPISVKTIDADHVNRFNAELEQADARPLYFFDTEGDRAGSLWFVRRLTVDSVKVDPKTAALEAKDLGLRDHNFWLAANTFVQNLATVKANPVPTAEAAPAPVSTPTNVPEAPTTPAPEPTSLRDGAATKTPPVLPRDPTAWRPYAALLVTGLGVPLAFWGRCSLFSLGAYVRASLPGTGKTPRALPASSDV